MPGVGTPVTVNEPGGLAVNVVAVLEKPPPVTVTVAPPSPTPSAVTIPVIVDGRAVIVIICPVAGGPASSRMATTLVATPAPLNSSTYVAGVGRPAKENAPTEPLVGVTVTAGLPLTVVTTAMSPSGVPVGVDHRAADHPGRRGQADRVGRHAPARRPAAG